MKLYRLIRVACLLMALALLLMSASVVACAQSKSVTLTVFENETLTAEINPHKEVASLNGPSAKGEQQLTFAMEDVTKNPIHAELSLPWNGTLHTVVMEGRVDEITSNKLTGNRGAFFGHISDNGTSIPVCLNVTYNSSGSLITLSVGAASETSNPEFMVYGNLTPSIAELNKAYADQRKLSNSGELTRGSGLDENLSTPNTSVRSDNSIYLQGSSVISSSGHNLGIVAILAPHNNEQGEEAFVIPRLVGCPANARSYLVNANNIPSNLIYDIYVTDAYIELSALQASKGRFFAPVNSIYPESRTSTAGFTISLGAIVELITAVSGGTFGWPLPDFDIEYVIESITKQTNGDGLGLATAMNWSFYKQYGITPMADALHIIGFENSTDGLFAFAGFSFVGALGQGEQVNAQLSTSGYLTYEYQYVTTLGMAAFDFVTTPGTATAIVTVTGD